MPDSNLECRSVSNIGPASLGECLPPILASVHLGAELRRVLYALAMPEYFEAWLRVPEIDRVECHPDSRSFDRFRIDLISGGVPQRSIFGSCFMSLPGRITYLWENGACRPAAPSVVEVQLFGNSAWCTMKLRQSGFSSLEEREWYSAVWRISLAGLSNLMAGNAIHETPAIRPGPFAASADNGDPASVALSIRRPQ
jgi:hypothetical protein